MLHALQTQLTHHTLHDDNDKNNNNNNKDNSNEGGCNGRKHEQTTANEDDNNTQGWIGCKRVRCLCACTHAQADFSDKHSSDTAADVIP